MSLDPPALATQLERLEAIEKATLRMVTQAIYDFRHEASSIFREETDLPQDVGEDVTREALDNMGMARIPVRLYGKIDYKRARYIFHPEYSLKQALFVDSKAEDIAGQRTATLQMAQTSMRVRQIRSDRSHDVAGTLPTILRREDDNYLTTTVFVKYNYQSEQDATHARNRLVNIVMAGLPNGMLQERYNPNTQETIWLAGRNAPTRGEPFRVRLAFDRLKEKAAWRVQRIELWPDERFAWDG